MENEVWISDALMDSTLIKFVETDMSKIDVDKAIQAGKLNKKGQPVPVELCAKKIWRSKGKSYIKSMPHLFYARSYWIVSAKAADVLRQFDLGGGALYPLEGIYQKDQATRIDGDFFCWIFGNVKTVFLEEHSPRAEPRGGSDERDWCKMPFNIKGDDIAVSTAALEGPDVWIDPTLFRSLFVSGNLARELKQAGLLKAFRLHKCLVI